jgi:DNA-binding beta-propeller fold protein YncE
MGDLEPGSTFAGHRIDALVGRGGMGVVYRAWDAELERPVALKVISPDLLEDAVTRERFLREAKAAARIEHPNVIPVYYAGEHEGVAYLVMRFVAGDDVRTLVRRDGPQDPLRAARIAEQMAAALDGIHAAGFVHRDVKPANVLLGPNDHVYLSDFGLAKRALSLGGTTKTGHWVGTLDYVSPEQIRGERVDARSDVYALAGVLHYMLTAKVPYPRMGDEAKLWAHISDPPPRPSDLVGDLPPALDDVVARGMAKDPEERFQSAGDLGAAAAAAVEGRTARERGPVASGAAAPVESPTVTAASPITTVPRDEAQTMALQRPRRRLRGGLLATGGVAAVVLAGAVAALALKDDPGSPNAPGAQASATATPTSEGVARVTKTVPVGFRGNGMAIAAGRLWVTGFESQVLYGYDAETGTRRGGVDIGLHAAEIVAAGNALWVARSEDSELVRVDARSRKVTNRLRTVQQPVTLAIDDTSVWAGQMTRVKGTPDVVERFNRRTGELIGRFDVPDGVRAIAVDDGAVWIVNRRRNTLARHKTDGKLLWNRRVGAEPLDVAVGERSIWVANKSDNTITRVNPQTRSPETLEGGLGPEQIVIREGVVWVASRGDRTLRRIDEKTRKPIGEPIEVGFNPNALAVGDGFAWANVLGNEALVRIAY